ncbi:hypothetical protein BU25DRAFT_405976 [Macroventuria anomochaeta]|uniref:Uncharacterized protein n=1 Tax=Macroventuria anomochaeta TaxID=301207 RepID=A0ACB6SGE0_9PLEO|nr:uncharacterized protein BU25DRAFT_405976 [Macroventuria anomochaeta]KAF2632650.1 hypothetical protein BU25DRAFT_405976 [Macroventuria anomochaeta]
MAFLALLWAGAESARKGDPTSYIWWFIVEMGWATWVIKVASVLIRLATAAQMGIFERYHGYDAPCFERGWLWKSSGCSG